jgi:hypothetical protein
VPNLIAMEVAGLGRTGLYAGSWSDWCSDPEASGGARLRTFFLQAGHARQKKSHPVSRVAFFEPAKGRWQPALFGAAAGRRAGASHPSSRQPRWPQASAWGWCWTLPVELLLVEGVDDVEGVEGVLEVDGSEWPVSKARRRCLPPFCRKRPAPAKRPGQRPLRQRV